MNTKKKTPYALAPLALCIALGTVCVEHTPTTTTATTHTLTVTASPLDGGTVTPATPLKVANGKPASISASAAKGYTFQGWTVSDGDNATVADPTSESTTVTLTSDATITAVFADDEDDPGTDPGDDPDLGYTLVVGVTPASGGTVTPRAKSGIEDGERVSVSATTASGYQFVNWTVASGTVEFLNPSAASTPVILSSDAEITANFSLRPLTLTVRANPADAGTFSPTSQSNITMGTEVNISATPAAGYAFTGWTVGPTGAATADPGASIADPLNAQTTLTMGHASATVTARFHVPTPTFTVTFDTDGGIPATIPSVTKDAGTALGADYPEDPTKDGYRFDGWYMVVGNTMIPKKITATMTISVGGEVSLKAKWVRRVTVSFNTNGGTPTIIQNFTGDRGEALGASLPTNVTRTDHAFEGWFDHNDVQYTNDTPITETVTLTAKWTPVFVDTRDGEAYRYVTILDQTWMAENLNYQTANSWCYGDNPANCAIYGRLYNRAAAQSACPTGWKLPSRGEWDKLLKTAADGQARFVKSVDYWDYYYDDYVGTDQFGFRALPGGKYYPEYVSSECDPDGYNCTDRTMPSSSTMMGKEAHWWRTADGGDRNAIRLQYNTKLVATNNIVGGTNYGLSVRCLKN